MQPALYLSSTWSLREWGAMHKDLQGPAEQHGGTVVMVCTGEEKKSGPWGPVLVGHQKTYKGGSSAGTQAWLLR